MEEEEEEQERSGAGGGGRGEGEKGERGSTEGSDVVGMWMC